MTTLLSLRNVTAAYTDRIVLNAFSLDVHRGDCLHITGENGSGKTTLLRLMAGLLQPMSGTVWRAPGCVLGYLPQYRRIDREFPLTVAEVVLSGLHQRKRLIGGFKTAHRERAAEMMDLMQIADLAPRPINELSGGQWQRTLLARALACNPDLLLLDEPDTHLDNAGKHFLRELLEREAERRTLVMVSHELLLGKGFQLGVRKCGAVFF